MSYNKYRELVCTMKPQNLEDIDETGYLTANPDVAAAGMTGMDHFRMYGHQEGRMQWMNTLLISEARDSKLSTISFRRGPVSHRERGEPIDFLPLSVKQEFDIPEQPPVSANLYGQWLIDEIRANPEKKYLDLGAGLRQIYFSNVYNMEIYKSYSTDVIGIGEDLPFEDDQFDGVFAFAVLEHVRRPWEVASEISRVIRPGGKIWIDYPFLQAVHGYPHHYFNATPQGHRSLFEKDFEIESLIVAGNQHPIYSIWWLLAIWKSGLDAESISKFESLTIGDILSSPPEKHYLEDYCAKLPQETQQIIGAGSMLIGTRRQSQPSEKPASKGRNILGWLKA